jgi:hypothetical protein
MAQSQKTAGTNVNSRRCWNAEVTALLRHSCGQGSSELPRGLRVQGGQKDSFGAFEDEARVS